MVDIRKCSSWFAIHKNVRQRILKVYLNAGDNAVFRKSFFDTYDIRQNRDALYSLSCVPNRNMLKLLNLRLDVYLKQLIIYKATHGGNLETIEWLCNGITNCVLINYRLELKCSMFRGAIKNGHIHVLKWVKETYDIQFFSVDYFDRNLNDGFMIAIEYGRLDVIKWFVNEVRNCPFYAKYYTQYAAKKGKLKILQFLLEIGADIDLLACYIIASDDDVKKYLKSRMQ